MDFFLLIFRPQNTFFVLSNHFSSATPTDKNKPSFVVLVKTFPCRHFPNSFQKSLLQILFPKESGPMVTTMKVPFKKFNRIVNIIPPFWSLAYISGHSSSAMVTTWERRSFRLESTLEFRHRSLQPYQESWRWCPGTAPLPSETLKHLALCILLCMLLRV